MFLDTKHLLASAQSIASTSAGATTAVGSALDLGVGEDKLGSSLSNQLKAGGMWFNAIVENSAIAASANSGTVTAKLFTHTAATSHASTVVASGTAVVTGTAKVTKVTSSTDLADGTILVSLMLPHEGLQRYVAAGFSAATKKITAGKVTAWIGKEPLVEAG